jgi:hypothetical protein
MFSIYNPDEDQFCGSQLSIWEFGESPGGVKLNDEGLNLHSDFTTRFKSATPQEGFFSIKKQEQVSRNVNLP